MLESVTTCFPASIPKAVGKLPKKVGGCLPGTTEFARAREKGVLYELCMFCTCMFTLT